MKLEDGLHCNNHTMAGLRGLLSYFCSRSMDHWMQDNSNKSYY